MSKFKRKYDHAKSKFSGEVKEAAGKLTGNEQLELKGKIQSARADLKADLNAEDRAEDLKENIAEKINNMIDKKENKKDSKK